MVRLVSVVEEAEVCRLIRWVQASLLGSGVCIIFRPCVRLQRWRFLGGGKRNEQRERAQRSEFPSRVRQLGQRVLRLLFRAGSDAEASARSKRAPAALKHDGGRGFRAARAFRGGEPRATARETHGSKRATCPARQRGGEVAARH